MRLSQFIDEHQEEIIGEWVEFARTLLPWAEGLTEKDLRDHAQEMLGAVADDMVTPQTDAEQAEKSKGRGDVGELSRIGKRHATERIQSGLDIDQLVSEYRALRASVL